MTLDLPDQCLSLQAPVVMGILNLTPDSFSDGGRWTDLDAALAQAGRMVEEGAGFIDVGGESTRPGAQPVPEAEEARRVLPVIERLLAQPGWRVSVDTSKPGIMRAALALGAHLINDVHALQAPGALEAVAASRAAVCLMHRRGGPQDMQNRPQYQDVVGEVEAFLAARIEACEQAGIARGRIAIDPGIGFGKTLDHNLALLRALPRLGRLGCPILVGVSRKSLFGQLLGRPLEQRLAGSVAAAALAVRDGARIVRAHDVAPTLDAIRLAAALS
ncbi:MAG TPA: dihydropteroate synthase [Nevskiaceae bacterium]|nr:dihydropteroate synthase [Nevskiaceae bacterium]